MVPDKVKYNEMTNQQVIDLIIKDLNLRLDFIASFNNYEDVVYEAFDYGTYAIFITHKNDALRYIKQHLSEEKLVIVKAQKHIQVYLNDDQECGITDQDEGFIQYEILEIENPLFGTKEFVKNSIKRKLLYANDRQIAKLVEQATKIDKDIIETRTRTEKNQQKLKQWFFKDKE